MITGASGMLGQALIRSASAKYRTLGVSRRALPGGAVCDLSKADQVEALFSANPAKLVIHSAAVSDVDGCESDPKTAYECNTLAAKLVAESCQKYRIPWIYVSTDYVFDGRKQSLYSENEPENPVNIYGLTKWLGEYYAKTGPVSSAVVRTSWLFGPGNPQNFVNAICERLRREKKISVLDDQTNSPTSVKDLGLALWKIAEYLLNLPDGSARHEIFQICNRGTATRLEMAERMRDWLKLPAVVEKTDRSQIKNRLAVRPQHSALSTRHYEEFFKQTLRPWQESLKEYLAEASCAS